MSEERYTPTKLEWLVLNVEARVPMLLSQMRMLQKLDRVDDVRVFFRKSEPDTVVIVLRYLKGVPTDVVQALDAEIERELHELAKYYEWDGWLKILRDFPEIT